MAAAVAMDARIFKIFMVFLPNMADKTAKNPMPSTPPSVFPIRSVISLAPMANTNCMVSYKRLTPAMGRTFCRNPAFLYSMDMYRPNGTKARIFRTIYDISAFPFTIAEPANGIRLMFRSFMPKSIAKSVLILNPGQGSDVNKKQYQCQCF